MKERGIRSQIGLLAAAVSAVFLLVLPAAVVSGDEGPAVNAFARRVAGTYLLVDIRLDGEPAVWNSLLTLSADGNVVSEDTTDFGHLIPPTFQSSQRGTWKQTGRNKLVSTALEFDYFPDGADKFEFGGYVLVTATLSFDKRFDAFTVEDGAYFVFGPDQDPLDPSAVPFFEGTWTGNGRRVKATH